MNTAILERIRKSLRRFRRSPYRSRGNAVEPLSLRDPEAVSEAIVVWTGWGETSSPARDDQRLADQIGNDAAADLLPVVRLLEEEFYGSDAGLLGSDLVEMGHAAGERFKRMYPKLSDDAVNAFTWCYTYDHK